MRPLIFAAVLLAAGPALAQSGVPPARTDQTPAAPTAGAAPDGGRTYQYPPNTATILPPENRTPYSGAGQAPARPTDGSAPVPGLSNKPAEQVGK